MNPIDAYKNTESDQAESLLNSHADLVKRIAYHIYNRLPKNNQVDDLIQAGMIGLLDAIQNFDDSKGASFKTYASLRIRGNILDDLRKNEWLPRSVTDNSKRIMLAIREVEASKGGTASAHEIASFMSISIEEYHKTLGDACYGDWTSLYTEDDTELGIDHEHTPVEDVQREEIKGLLKTEIKTLPEKEGLVLSLYYNDELNFKEIGQVLSVSESRICQLHSQALARLRVRLSQKISLLTPA